MPPLNISLGHFNAGAIISLEAGLDIAHFFCATLIATGSEQLIESFDIHIEVNIVGLSQFESVIQSILPACCRDVR